MLAALVAAAWLALSGSSCTREPADIPWAGTWREAGTTQRYTVTITPQEPVGYTVEW